MTGWHVHFPVWTENLSLMHYEAICFGCGQKLATITCEAAHRYRSGEMAAHLGPIFDGLWRFINEHK